jgi:hypothetical protein
VAGGRRRCVGGGSPSQATRTGNTFRALIDQGGQSDFRLPPCSARSGTWCWKASASGRVRARIAWDRLRRIMERSQRLAWPTCIGPSRP